VRINPRPVRFFLCGLLLVACHVSAQQADVSDAPIPGVERLRAFLDDITSLKAGFYQSLLNSGGEVLERASGELVIERPGRFVWRYVEPFEQLVVADGKNLWIYDAELAQATVTPQDEATRASPAMLLSGEVTIDEEFVVRESFNEGELSWVRLQPRATSADFKEVLIGFDAQTLRRLQLLDTLDQVTSLEFSDVESNFEIADDAFEFVPPSGVDVIGEPG